MNALEPPPQVSVFNWIWTKWLYNLYVYIKANILTDYALEVARGNVTGVSQVNKFGRNSNIASGATEEIWDGSVAYVFPATALMTSISQTTDQTAMRGASIEIQGLNAAWEAITQTIALDATDTTTPIVFTAATDVVLGTTGVAMLRVFRIKVLADVVSTSQIRVHNVGETVDYAIIDTGNNQTLMAIYTVPAGKTAYMTSYYAHHNPVTNQDPTSNPIGLWARDKANSYEAQIKHVVGLPTNGGFQHFYNPYTKYTEKTDLYITSSPVGKAADVSAGFDLFLIDN